MELEATLLERARNWEGLSRWERSELGKDLRRFGLSYGEIMELVPVKKSTLATWCRDITLTEEQTTGIHLRTGPQEGQSRDTQWRRREEIQRIRAEATSQVSLLIRNPLWISGVTLYWAEGAKTRNHLRLANTDPNALRLFVTWVRAFLDPDAEFSMQLHLHEGNDDEAARAHWRRETGLVDANFYKSFIKPKGTGHRRNHLPHGVCTIKVRRCSDGWYRTMAWIEELPTHLGVRSAD